MTGERGERDERCSITSRATDIMSLEGGWAKTFTEFTTFSGVGFPPSAGAPAGQQAVINDDIPRFGSGTAVCTSLALAGAG